MSTNQLNSQIPENNTNHLCPLYLGIRIHMYIFVCDKESKVDYISLQLSNKD